MSANTSVFGSGVSRRLLRATLTVAGSIFGGCRMVLGFVRGGLSISRGFGYVLSITGGSVNNRELQLRDWKRAVLENETTLGFSDWRPQAEIDLEEYQYQIDNPEFTLRRVADRLKRLDCEFCYAVLDAGLSDVSNILGYYVGGGVCISGLSYTGKFRRRTANSRLVVGR